MHEVRERRPEPAQEQRHANGHAQLLDAAGELDRLDPRRDELGPPRDRREAKSVADGRQRAQKILDVRLVARALPAEHVGVDHDERIAHAPSS